MIVLVVLGITTLATAKIGRKKVRNHVKTILVVDDSLHNLLKVKHSLEKHYRVITLSSAEKMFALLDKLMPDLIMLDIEMPDIDGFGAIAKLNEDETTAKIPVLFLTSHTDEMIEAKGFELGAVDFISKPFSTPVLLNRLATHLHIDELIKKRTKRIEQLHSSILSILVNVVEHRDSDTGGHIERTSKYLELLITSMLKKDTYSSILKSWDLKTVVSSARLHDIGKLTVRDAILNKPGKLTPEELVEMRRHAIEGKRIIGQVISIVGDDSFLHHAEFFAEYHHERWDGEGYPKGLKGDNIPLQGRLMAIVDVYDALISVRPYKEAYDSAYAEQIISEGAGSAFDPLLIEVFNDIKESFAAIAKS
ncbi:MAG: response regulator [Oscillospiraceae bacterium]|nr:response regulator [Oscillospiraceae bacterium]